MDYFLHILVLFGIFATLAVSLDLLVGWMGYMSVAHASLFGIGAYGTALSLVNLHAPFLIAIIIGVLLAILASFVLTMLTSRISQEYVIISTFAFQMVVFIGMGNWVQVTGGPYGVVNIPRPLVFGMTISSTGAFALSALLLMGLTIVCCRVLVRAPLKRVLRAIAEDEAIALSVGKNTTAIKFVICAFAAVFAALAGGLYATYMRYIDANSFSLTESILIFCMVVIGGPRTRVGPVAGALVFAAIPTLFRLIGMPSSSTSQLRQLFFAILLVVIVIKWPAGMAGDDSDQALE